ncbi:MAG TPA: coat protein [Desulfosporosinus sp.]|nr:coat protein [Desulfosporosinus sp.]
MAATKVSNIIIPEIFNPYVVERTAELSALVRSGIVVPDPQMDVLASAGGTLINMPFFTDLTGDDDLLDDTADIPVNAIGTNKDIATLLMRTKSWGVTDLAKSISGDDPMRAIGDLVADYWARKEQTTLIKILTGVFADNIANDSADHVHDVSIADGANAASTNLIGANSVIEASALLGDAMMGLTAIAMHSVCYANLQKQNLIDFTPTNVQNVGFGTYLGKTVIVDDGCPSIAGGTSGKVYTSYLFGRGAIARGEGKPEYPTEMDRDSLGSGGTDVLITRRHYILHPRGIKFTSASVVKTTPTNSELALAANWDRVYESKNIRLVALKTNG